MLKKLWIDTFHDTEEYVDMLFRHYYNPRLCLQYAESGRLISSSFMIPFEMTGGEEDERLRVGYICGLATVPERRGEGIMSRLLEALEQRAREEGFVATFLIPADDGLREYYRRRGYENTATVVKYELRKAQSASEPSGEECVRIYTQIEYERVRTALIDDAKRWERGRRFTILHNDTQWDDVFCDMLRDGGSLWLGKQGALYCKADGEIGRLYGEFETVADIISRIVNGWRSEENSLRYRCADDDEAEEIRGNIEHLRSRGVDVKPLGGVDYGMAKPLFSRFNLRLMLD